MYAEMKWYSYFCMCVYVPLCFWQLDVEGWAQVKSTFTILIDSCKILILLWPLTSQTLWQNCDWRCMVEAESLVVSVKNTRRLVCKPDPLGFPKPQIQLACQGNKIPCWNCLYLSQWILQAWRFKSVPQVTKKGWDNNLAAALYP